MRFSIHLSLSGSVLDQGGTTPYLLLSVVASLNRAEIAKSRGGWK